MNIIRQSIFGATDLLELTAIVTVSLVTVWIVPDWLIPHKTMQLYLHLNQVFLGCIAQIITNSRFALSVCVLAVDVAAATFQYGIWSGYVLGLGLDRNTGEGWKEHMKFGILVLLLFITASRTIDSRVEIKASDMARQIESRIAHDNNRHKQFFAVSPQPSK